MDGWKTEALWSQVLKGVTRREKEEERVAVDVSLCRTRLAFDLGARVVCSDAVTPPQVTVTTATCTETLRSSSVRAVEAQTLLNTAPLSNDFIYLFIANEYRLSVMREKYCN